MDGWIAFQLFRAVLRISLLPRFTVNQIPLKFRNLDAGRWPKWQVRIESKLEISDNRSRAEISSLSRSIIISFFFPRGGEAKPRARRDWIINCSLTKLISNLPTMGSPFNFNATRFRSFVNRACLNYIRFDISHSGCTASARITRSTTRHPLILTRLGFASNKSGYSLSHRVMSRCNLEKFIYPLNRVEQGCRVCLLVS